MMICCMVSLGMGTDLFGLRYFGGTVGGNVWDEHTGIWDCGGLLMLRLLFCFLGNGSPRW